VETAIEACQAEHVLDPCNIARSVYVDTGGTSAVDFDLSEAQQEALLQAGMTAAREFLARWDFDSWRGTCR
jgi:NTE family protein